MPAMPTPPDRSSAARGAGALAAIGVILIAANLRPTVTSVAALLPEIRADLGLSPAAAELLTATPVICFGLLAPFAPRIADRLGMERTLGVVLLALAAGLVIRVGPNVATLFLGTIVAGGAIALANVLLPALVKRDFPLRVGALTGGYTTTLQIAAAVAAGLSVPIALALGGWRGGLWVWAIPALLAFIVWLPQMRARTLPDLAAVGPSVRSLLRDSLAWQVTIFFGLQSLGFYAIVSWLPSIYQDAGFSAADAGLVLSVATLAGAPASLLMPLLATRASDQRLHAIAVCLLIGTGLLGVIVAPTTFPWLWAILIGFGNGASFPLALTLLVLRTRSSTDTARLSAMAQSIGYLIAALGPVLVGVVHDATGSWAAAVALLIAMLVPQAISGVGAGRRLFVGGGTQGAASATAPS
jgi:CP family cyanate transporter-like MFS transporter